MPPAVNRIFYKCICKSNAHRALFSICTMYLLTWLIPHWNQYAYRNHSNLLTGYTCAEDYTWIIDMFVSRVKFPKESQI